MSTTSKVPGFTVAEFVRDAADARFQALLPRIDKEPDANYVARLAEAGLVVVLEREALRTGGYPMAKAQAVVRGVPLLVPMESGEMPMSQAFGTPSDIPTDSDGKAEWYLEQKKHILQAERDRATLYANPALRP
jgi:hypothetical protein